MTSARIAALAVAGALVVAGCSGQPAPPTVPASAAPSGSSTVTTGEVPSAPPSATPVTVRELPRGGTRIFPAYRLFGYSGYPGAPGQGRLGIGKLDDRLKEIEKRGRAYLKGRELLPVMELIAVTVHGVPGRDGKYRTRVDDRIIKKWLAAARRHKALLLLNIQPGRADFLDEVKHFEKWLREPDIGLALDPEWAVGPRQIPGRVYGSTTGKELDSVARWVSRLIAANGLPEKVIVFHQLHAGIVKKPKDLKEHPGVAIVKSIDGIGSPGAKVATWKRVIKNTPDFIHSGFKLFYQEDVTTGGRLMTAKEVLALKPTPEYILFE